MTTTRRIRLQPAGSAVLAQGMDEIMKVVLNGNLLTLPVGGGILYVQPVYLKSTGETSYPTLQRVLVAFGGGREHS